VDFGAMRVDAICGHIINVDDLELFVKTRDSSAIIEKQ
jgi:hypothetical protein